MENVISFPGLGIGEFTLKRVAFPLFGRDIMWYGILIMLGIVAAFLLIYRLTKLEKISFDDLLDYALITVMVAIVGARLYYVVTDWNSGRYQSFLDVIAIWRGGIAIYGAILFGGIAVVLISLHKKICVTKALDMIVPGVMLGQIIGRWGNFMNAEAFGELTQFEVFGKIFKTPFFADHWFLRMGINGEYWHPTFLYESVWNLIGLALILALYKKKKYHGRVFLMYITWYGFGRFFIEGFRTDSLMVGSFRISQLLAFLCFVVGSVLLIVFAFRFRESKPILEKENVVLDSEVVLPNTEKKTLNLEKTELEPTAEQEGFEKEKNTESKEN